MMTQFRPRGGIVLMLPTMLAGFNAASTPPNQIGVASRADLALARVATDWPADSFPSEFSADIDDG